MKRRSVSLFAGAVVALLFAGGSARADFVEWNFNFFPKVPSSSPYLIKSDTSDTSYIQLSNEDPGSAAGSSDLVATSIAVFSDAGRGTPDVFDAAGEFVLQFQLTDAASGESAPNGLLFKGKFSGELSGKSSKLGVEFVNDGEFKTEYTVTLGGNTYTVTIGQYTPPGAPENGNPGALGVHVEVNPGDIQKSPEPSTMLLGCIGLAGMGLAGWRKRRQAARA
jgi:hypothetical protein